jgi:CheY-like chemotaxis protein
MEIAMRRRPLILCVDDEWNGLEGRKMLLEESGYKVLVATIGLEAVQLFSSHPVDLVLIDYHMPGMNRDVVAEHMKVSQPDVPIAMSSADDGIRESAPRWVDAFVSKSKSPANLLQVVEYLLDLRLLFAPVDDLTGGRQRHAA